MEPRNNNYMQLATQESNINKSAAKMNLLKTFKSKRLPKSCSRFLPSIVTLSILSVANSSFAFPAKVKPNRTTANPTMSLYYLPSQDPQFLDDKQLYTKLIGNTLVDVLYCRGDRDEWCYMSGYYSHHARQEAYTFIKAWVKSNELCDSNLDNSSFLQSCDDEQQPFPNIEKANSFIKGFFCELPNDKNPWKWLVGKDNKPLLPLDRICK